MRTSPPPFASSPGLGAAPQPPLRVPTPQQQQVLDRIRTQRERLRAQRLARLQFGTLRSSSAGTGTASRINPNDPLSAKLLAFARLHPWASAAAAALAATAGSKRLLRWGGVVVPILMRLRG